MAAKYLDAHDAPGCISSARSCPSDVVALKACPKADNQQLMLALDVPPVALQGAKIKRFTILVMQEYLECMS